MLLFPPRAWIKKHCLMTILSADTDSGVYGVWLLPGAAVNGGCYQLFGGCTGVQPNAVYLRIKAPVRSPI